MGKNSLKHSTRFLAVTEAITILRFITFKSKEFVRVGSIVQKKVASHI
jgi:hypothetical protein